jgi:hypothetical protein
MHALFPQTTTFHPSTAGLPLFRPPRVLVLSVSAGVGHVRAAEGVELALRQIARLAQLKANARRIGRPRSAFAVAEKALTFTRQAAPRNAQ